MVRLSLTAGGIESGEGEIWRNKASSSPSHFFLKGEDMREYQNYEDACRDRDLNLMIIYRCESCGNEREDVPNCNVGGNCECGGVWQKAGESYNA